jgi:Protein of unknown function (DUF4232)
VANQENDSLAAGNRPRLERLALLLTDDPETMNERLRSDSIRLPSARGPGTPRRARPRTARTHCGGPQDEPLHRGRSHEALIRAARALALPLGIAALCAGCAGQSTPASLASVTATATASGTSTPTTIGTSPTPAAVSSVVRSRPHTCLTSGLSVRLGAEQGAAGSVYEPILFTNTSGHPCTLFGYPGVSFVAPGTGHQVGSAAFRNPQHAPSGLTLAPGASASAMLQVVDDHNFPPTNCQTVTVSGLRVYPPGNTAAAYVPFGGAATACSTHVIQLTVEATVIGRTGQ